jgi:hypothetical protein
LIDLLPPAIPAYLAMGFGMVANLPPSPRTAPVPLPSPLKNPVARETADEERKVPSLRDAVPSWWVHLPPGLTASADAWDARHELLRDRGRAVLATLDVGSVRHPSCGPPPLQAEFSRRVQRLQQHRYVPPERPKASPRPAVRLRRRPSTVHVAFAAKASAKDGGASSRVTDESILRTLAGAMGLDAVPAGASLATSAVDGGSSMRYEASMPIESQQARAAAASRLKSEMSRPGAASAMMARSGVELIVQTAVEVTAVDADEQRPRPPRAMPTTGGGKNGGKKGATFDLATSIWAPRAKWSDSRSLYDTDEARARRFEGDWTRLLDMGVAKLIARNDDDGAAGAAEEVAEVKAVMRENHHVCVAVFSYFAANGGDMHAIELNQWSTFLADIDIINGKSAHCKKADFDRMCVPKAPARSARAQPDSLVKACAAPPTTHLCADHVCQSANHVS